MKRTVVNEEYRTSYTYTLIEPRQKNSRRGFKATKKMEEYVSSYYLASALSIDTATTETAAVSTVPHKRSTIVTIGGQFFRVA